MDILSCSRQAAHLFDISRYSGIEAQERAGDGRRGILFDNTPEQRGSDFVIPVSGPIFRRDNAITHALGVPSVDSITADLGDALRADSVKRIIFVLDSPGGSISGMSELANRIFEARSLKIITAYIDGEASGAAYWLASAANKIIASETAVIGGIGVVFAVPPKSDNPVEIVSSQSPRKRADPSTDEGRADYVSIASDLAAVMIESIGRNRAIPASAVVSRFREGGLMIGREAVNSGAADRVGSLDRLLSGSSDTSTPSTPSSAPTARDLGIVNDAGEFTGTHQPAPSSADTTTSLNQHEVHDMSYYTSEEQMKAAAEREWQADASLREEFSGSFSTFFAWWRAEKQNQRNQENQ